MATLVFGPNRISSPALDGKTVTQLRCDYRGAYNIPDDAAPTVNGQTVPESTVLRSSDELVFNKATGAKGA